MAELRDFQKASSARIMEYYEQTNNHRYLLADEVGLGKTIIAADVIDKFVKANKAQGVGSAVYYVCGNLALIAQNEKKLRAGFENYEGYEWKESRHEDMSRLVLSFVRQNYLKDFDGLVEIVKAVAVWMLAEGSEYTREMFYRKDGEVRSNFLCDAILIIKLFGQHCSTCNFYRGKLEDWDEIYLLLLEVYNKIKGKVLEESVIDKLRGINKTLEKYEYINSKEKYQALSDDIKDRQLKTEHALFEKLAEFVPVYDDLAQTKKISFQSITPRTSLEKTGRGTWIERAAAGIVYYKWKKKEQKKCVQIFEKELDALIRGDKNEDGFKYVLPVIKNGEYAKTSYKTLIDSTDAKMAMFLYHNITAQDVDTIMNAVGSVLTEAELTEEYARKLAKEFLKTIMDRMAIYSLQKTKKNKKILVVVDEFQNYSSVLGTEEIPEECAKVREELLLNQDTENLYVLLLSATPFHFANANMEKDFQFQSDLQQINSEVDLILNYIMGEEKYKAWLDKTDTNEKYQYMYEEGISRTERGEGSVVNGNMTLRYCDEKDYVLLKRDITTMLPFHNFEVAQGAADGDLVILCRDNVYIYRSGKFYFAPDEVVSEISDLLCLYDAEETDETQEDKKVDATFFKCFVWEDNELDWEPQYEYVKKPGKEEEKVWNRLNSQCIPLSYIKDTPWLLSFAQDYKINMTSRENEYMLDAERLKSYERIETKHARYQKLQNVLLREHEAYKLLYIPPSKPDYKLWGVYECFDNANENPVYFSKSLVFSQNYHTPRAFSAMLSYESERLNHLNAGEFSDGAYEDRTRYDLSGGKWRENESEKINARLIEEEIRKYRELKAAARTGQPYAECIQKSVIDPEKDSFCLGSMAGYFLDMEDVYGWNLQNGNLEKILLAIYSVFLTKEAHDIICVMDGENYMNKIYAYSAQGNLRSVLDEYIHLILEEEHLEKQDSHSPSQRYQKLLEILYDNYFATIEKYVKGNQFRIKARTADGSDIDIFTGYAQGITGDEGKADTQRALKNKIVCFNSPFRPFVFTTTSVGAEGLDFHWFCRNIYHWALEMNPEKFQQKEGRINRFHCHCVRQNLGRDFPEKSWKDIYKSDMDGNKNPFCPEWIYEGNGKNEPYASLSRNTCYYPGSYEDYAYKDMIQNMKVYREIINGQYLSPFYLCQKKK